jgi:hypothetical protein
MGARDKDDANYTTGDDVYCLVAVDEKSVALDNNGDSTQRGGDNHFRTAPISRHFHFACAIATSPVTTLAADHTGQCAQLLPC